MEIVNPATVEETLAAVNELLTPETASAPTTEEAAFWVNWAEGAVTIQFTGGAELADHAHSFELEGFRVTLATLLAFLDAGPPPDAERAEDV